MSAVRDFSTRARGRRFSRSQQALLAAGAAAFLLAAWSAGDAWGERAAARSRVQQVRGEVEAARARVRQLQASRGPDQSLAMQALLTAEAPPPGVLAELARLLPGDVRLDSLELAYGEQVMLDMRVAARRPGSFDLFVDRLQQSPLFADVLPGEEAREGEMRATVRARYRGGAR